MLQIDLARVQELTVNLNPHLECVQKRFRDLQEALHFNEVLETLTALEEEIHTMQLAGRFGPSKPDLKMSVSTSGPVSYEFALAGTLREFKKIELAQQIAEMRRVFNTLHSLFESFIMDLEASKTEG